MRWDFLLLPRYTFVNLCKIYNLKMLDSLGLVVFAACCPTWVFTALERFVWKWLTPWRSDNVKLDVHINLMPPKQFSVFSNAIYLYYAFRLQNLLNHIKQKLLFKFWNFQMSMKYVWTIVSIELFAGRGHFVNNRFPSIIADTMTNSWSRIVVILIIFHFCYILPLLHIFFKNR